MLGYVSLNGNFLSNYDLNDSYNIHKIKSFNNPEKINSYIAVYENNNVLFVCHKIDIVFNAITHKKIEILNWYIKSGYEIIETFNKCFDGDIIEIYSYVDYASFIGSVEILDWLNNSNYNFKHTEWGMFYASKKGHVQVLKWFKDSNHKFKYNKWVFIYSMNFIVLKFLTENINSKKVIKWTKNIYCSISRKAKKLKFKTKNNYIKGYNKN
jgi:hypothetical protein